MNEEKDKLNNAKFEIDFAASVRNKAKADLKRELRATQNEINEKIKEKVKIK